MPISKTSFDYAIIGAGAAGMQLALAMKEEPFFNDKHIVIIEKTKKNLNDKTWCFWEQGNGKWDDIIYKKWNAGYFIDGQGSLVLDFSPYTYKMIRSIDFYQYGINQLKNTHNIEWIDTEAIDVNGGNPAKILTTSGEIRAKHIFDSSIDRSFYVKEDKHIRLLQHFKGWEIETEKPIFNDQIFTMMDFRLSWPNTTSFIYVLPTASNKALIEFTFFNKSLIENQAYDEWIKKYIQEYLLIEEFEIKAKEFGVIPMTTFPFHKDHTKYLTKIGTAGGWVKPSSGYSFKNAENYVKIIINNIINDNPPYLNILNKKFMFYDNVFLTVLSKHNKQGPHIFSDMYRKNKVEKILKFLDNQTNLYEDLKIISSFDKVLFTKAAIKTLLK